MSEQQRDGQPEPVVIRDKRRIDVDPERAASGPVQEPEAAPSAELAERTADLQRLQAEFANYRKRVERDRVSVRENAIGDVLAGLLPVLDDIDRARSHGDLTGAFKAVADQFDGLFAKLGLVAFGEAGDPFDPSVHEAVMHSESQDVTEPTATTVMRKGYRHGERLLRPAMVGVSEPAQAPVEAPATSDKQPAEAATTEPASPNPDVPTTGQDRA